MVCAAHTKGGADLAGHAPPGVRFLHVQRAFIGGQGGFLDDFAEGGVGVDGAREVLAATAELHDGDDFADQFADAAADHVHAQQFVGLGVRDDFHEAARVAVAEGASVRAERELSGLDAQAPVFGLLLGQAGPGDLGAGVDHPGDHVVVHVPGLPGQHLGKGHAFLLGLVGQHGAADHVADGKDVLEVGAVVLVDLHEAAFIQCEAHRVGPEALRVRDAADGHDQLVETRGDFLVLLGVRDAHAAVVLLDGGDVHTEVEVQALFLEELQAFLGNRVVGGHQEAGQGFQDGHVGAQAAPDAAEFQADDARADHAEFLRDGREFQRAAVLHDVPAEGRQGERAGAAAGRDDHARGADLGAGGVHDPAVTVRADQFAQPEERRDLVLLEQVRHAARQFVDHAVLAAQHLRDVQGRALHVDAVLGEVILHDLELLTAVQHRLAGNAAHVQAGASQAGLAVPLEGVHAGRFEAQLGRTNGRHVTRGAATNHQYVERIHSALQRTTPPKRPG